MFERITQIRKNRRKVLGLNERYLEYIRPNNLKKAIEIADDKILTKRILEKHDIPVPELFAVIQNREELQNVNFNELPKAFVLKPVHGVRGGGVEIFYNRDKNGNWIRSDGSRISEDGLKILARDILDGKYSLNNEADIVMIEERVKPHKAFRYYSYKGTPDVRVIVYNKIPVMAMLRLPTRQSEGKGNLDQGAIGAGIDLAVGKTTYAIIGKKGEIEYVPEYKIPLSGLKIPYWNTILENSIKASEASGLGFCAADFLIDREKGPVIVELNARAGLSIQLANDSGLRWRLRKAGGLSVKSVSKGIRLAKDLFGGEIELGIESLSGKDVIGIYETVKVTGVNNKTETLKAKIDTGADSTSIDKEVARKLGYQEILDVFEDIKLDENMGKKEAKEKMAQLAEELVPKYEYLQDVNLVSSSHGMSLRPYVRITLNIDQTEFETNATIYDRSKLKYPIIVGRKSLFKFLVDPSKKK